MGATNGTFAIFGVACLGLALLFTRLDAAAEFTCALRDDLDRIDRGEAVAEADDPIGYQHMEADQRAAIRAGWLRPRP